jgi:hypothetical protein
MNVRGDALEFVVGQLAAAADQSGDVGAMPVIVIRAGRNAAAGEIPESRDATRKVAVGLGRSR